MSFQNFLKKGWRGIIQELNWLHYRLREKRNYQKWLKQHEINDETRAAVRRRIEGFQSKPLISIVLPVYDVGEKWLRLCIESVIKQIYENWELCIADDASPSPHIRNILEEYAAKDGRIKVIFRPENGHISAASNSALELATGEFTVLLDHDDELSIDALFWVVNEINDFPETMMIYSDEDLISVNGKRFDPKFKPDWSRDHFYSANIVTHLSAYKTEVLRRIGGFRIGLEGSQDYDLALRAIEQISEKQIRHIPRILYHWRVVKGSVALSGDEKPYAHKRAPEAIRSHFQRIGKKARVIPTIYNLHRVRYELPSPPPKVSLILTALEDFEFTQKSLKDILGKTSYADFETILISPGKNAARFDELISKMSGRSIKIINSSGRNLARDLNFAVSKSNGEILCFTEINLLPLSNDWLTELSGFALQEEIGAVGGKIFKTDQTLLHGGLIIGTDKIVETAHPDMPRKKNGHISRAKIINNFSAVSVACMATRRENFLSAGGFDAENLPNNFFDADYCLKLKEQKFRVVFTPYAELIQKDKNRQSHLNTSPTAGETKFFTRKWQKYIMSDPAYNPNFSKKDGSFSINI